MAGPWVCALIDVRALEAVAAETDSTLALTPPFCVCTEGVFMATPVVLLALVNVLAVVAISIVSRDADAEVAAERVVAAGFLVTAVQSGQTLVDVSAHQTVALVAHVAHAGEVVLDLQAVGLRVAPAARCLTFPRVSNWKEEKDAKSLKNEFPLCQILYDIDEVPAQQWSTMTHRPNSHRSENLETR